MSIFKGRADIVSLYKLLLPEKKIVAKFSVSLLISSGAALCFPLAMNDIYSLCKENTDSSSILKSVGKWTLVFTIGSIATYTRRLSIDQLVISTKANKLAISLRQSYFEALLHKRMPIFAEQNSGNLAHQLGHDIWQISHTIIYEFSSALRGAAFFTGGIGFLLYTSVPLTLVTLLPISSLAVISRYYGGKLKKERETFAVIARNSQAYTQERLAQIKTVKLFTSEGLELKRYKEIMDKLYTQGIVVANLGAKHHGIMEGLGQNAVLWCIGYGAYLISLNSGLSLGKLTAFAMYSMYSGLGFRLLASGYTELKKVSGIYQQIYENATSKEEETINLDLTKKIGISYIEPFLKPINPFIQFKNVSFKYPGRDSKILDNLSLDINHGEIIGIVGQSGSGKSSIFNMLTHLYQPSDGKVYINGVNLAEKPAFWPRQMISIVSQEALLFSGTVLDNVMYSDVNASEEAVVEACKRADAYDFIMEMPDKFLTQVGEQGNALSGGQRQRVLIARALLKKPHIFLFDEATSALDANSEGYFQEVIEKEFRGKGFTVLIISHRVKALKDITDRIMLIDEGKIIAFDTYENLAKHPEFQLLL